MDSTKKKELLLLIVAVIVIIGGVFWFLPSRPFQSAPLTAQEKFEQLFLANHYPKLPFDRYNNLRLVSSGGDKKMLTALFQISLDTQSIKEVFGQYFEEEAYANVKEQRITRGFKLSGEINGQPLTIRMTKAADSETISNIALTFQPQDGVPIFSYDKLPSNFPADIPVEYSTLVTQITQNDTVRINDKTQGTLVINSANTGDENFAIYLNYLGGHDWTILKQLNDPKQAVKSIFASNESGSMVVNITPGRSPDVSIVSIFFLTP
ncbi:MAG: hypothetical protein Q8R34_02560 [bacterium]|nr:hypothetical protein [bacterium]